MKKIVPFISILSLLALGASAQNLRITRNNTGTNVTSGKVIVVTDDSSLVKEDFTVELATATRQGNKVKVKRLTLSDINGTSNSFCWAEQCYPPDVSVSPDAVDFELVLTTPFTIDFYPNTDDKKHTGVIHLRYIFFNADNVNDSTFFDFQLEIKPNSAINNAAKIAATVSSVYPNPAITEAEVKFKFDANYALVAKVYNILGAEVATQQLAAKQGVVTIPVTALENGIYFIAIIAGNKSVVTRKFTVLH